MPMKAGSGDREYLDVYQKTLPPLMKRFSPDLILVSAGYDILSDDPLSNIHVSHEGIRLIVQAILQSASVPVVISLEGGYHLRALSEAVRITLEEMLKQ
jgi:acetoin utilization deacetylase AcuC-like enzyme